MRRITLVALAILAASPALSSMAYAERWNDLHGDGVRDLFPALQESGRGRDFVLREFDFDGDGWIDRREADAANRAFFDLADRNRNGRLSYDEVQHGLNLTDPKHHWTREERERLRY